MYISLYSPKQEEFTCKLMLNNCSVPENNVLKCSGIYRAIPWNNYNRISRTISLAIIANRTKIFILFVLFQKSHTSEVTLVAIYYKQAIRAHY